jgi:hypothetical protein
MFFAYEGRRVWMDSLARSHMDVNEVNGPEEGEGGWMLSFRKSFEFEVDDTMSMGFGRHPEQSIGDMVGVQTRCW